MLASKVATMTPAHRALGPLLKTALGDDESAMTLMATAIRRAALPRAPDDERGLLAFVEEHLRPLLAEEVGPRLAEALLADWANAFAPPSSVRLTPASTWGDAHDRGNDVRPSGRPTLAGPTPPPPSMSEAFKQATPTRPAPQGHPSTSTGDRSACSIH